MYAGMYGYMHVHISKFGSTRRHDVRNKGTLQFYIHTVKAA